MLGCSRIHQALTEKKIRRLKVRAASGNPGKPEMKPGRGKVLQKRRWKWITRRQQGSMCISAERLQIPACMSFPRTAGSTRRWMPQADLRRMRRVRASTSRRRSVTGCRSRSIIRKKLHRFRQAVRQQVKIPGRIRCRDLLHLST